MIIDDLNELSSLIEKLRCNLGNFARFSRFNDFVHTKGHLGYHGSLLHGIKREKAIFERLYRIS